MLEFDRSSDDDSLLNAWRGGDRRAGALLFERHYASIARFFVNKIGLDCDDLIQSTFLGCLEAIERFRGDCSFRALLFAIARNKLLKHLRERSRDRRRFSPADTSIAALLSSPTSVVHARREHQLLLAALRRLPLDTQILLELHYWERLTVREIAAVLDSPEGTVKIRMYRGRARLADEMQALAGSAGPIEATSEGLERWATQLRAELDAVKPA